MGCETVNLTGIKLRLAETTEKLEETVHKMRILNLYKVKEYCPFTETISRSERIEEIVIK
jgi:hypothetical protein